MYLFEFTCRCGTVSGPPGCYKAQDLTLKYPACCPHIVCPELKSTQSSKVPQGPEYEEFTNWVRDTYDYQDQAARTTV